MAITKEQVQYVADLARLEIAEQHFDKLADQIRSILDYVDTLEQVDTTDVTPTFHTVQRSNVFRPDEPAEHIEIEDALANAPQKEDRSFLVPRVIEG